MKIDPEDLVSTKDIARMAHVTMSAVSNWKLRHPDFPRPVVVVGDGEIPLYLIHHVQQYLFGRKKWDRNGN